VRRNRFGSPTEHPILGRTRWTEHVRRIEALVGSDPEFGGDVKRSSRPALRAPMYGARPGQRSSYFTPTSQATVPSPSRSMVLGIVWVSDHVRFLRRDLSVTSALGLVADSSEIPRRAAGGPPAGNGDRPGPGCLRLNVGNLVALVANHRGESPAWTFSIDPTPTPTRHASAPRTCPSPDDPPGC